MTDEMERVLEIEQKRVVRGVMQRVEDFVEVDSRPHRAIKGALHDWLDLFVLRVRKAVDDVPDKNNGHAIPAKNGRTGK
ncbi:MAG: hypothetical protein WC822_06070 [Candidatus Paceibacterota bacterium]|jgi:hypothetical protein